MIHQVPAPGLYVRRANGEPVRVLSCDGTWVVVTATDPNRTWNVRLDNFWRKYIEPVGDKRGGSDD